MSLLLAPYNNAMRIGQGFNSYTQQICIDDAVVVDPARLDNPITNDGFTMRDLSLSMGSKDIIKEVEQSAAPRPALPAPKTAPDHSEVDLTKVLVTLEGTILELETEIEDADDPNSEEMKKKTDLLERKKVRLARTRTTMEAAAATERSKATGKTGTAPRGPSQIVTYNSRFVDKLSEITDDMNISGSLSIKYGTIGGSGRGAFIDTDKFKESDLNFYISVKVINQTINMKDALVYQGLPSVTKDNFTEVYGDSFISGFLEGGEFNALVSMKVLNKEKKTDIEAEAKVALTVGPASADAQGHVKIAKSNISNNTETTIQVSWSGGGHIKPMNEPWTIESLMAAAARFPDLVAVTAQRTYAILTKYERLRSFLTLRPAKLDPLFYENAAIYTNSLMDTYMDYKNMFRKLSSYMFEVQTGVKKYMTSTGDLADVTTLARINDERQFASSNKGVDLAKRACMYQMMKIVKEVDEITKKPELAVDETRGEKFQSSMAFAERLPKLEPIVVEPKVPLSGLAIEASKETTTYPPLYEPTLTNLQPKDSEKLNVLVDEKPSLSEHFRLAPLLGSDGGDFFCNLEFLKNDFALVQVRVDISNGVVAALHLRYSNGLVTQLGSSRTVGRSFNLDIHAESNEKVIACSIEVGKPKDGQKERITSLRLYTNRGPDLLGQADDWKPAVNKEGVRGGIQFTNLEMKHFDPILDQGHLKGFWGRSTNATQQTHTTGLYSLAPIWGNIEVQVSNIIREEISAEHQVRRFPAGVWASGVVHGWKEPMPHTSGSVNYTPEFPETAPIFFIGARNVDGGGQNMAFKAYTESITTKTFDMSVDQFSNSEFWSNEISWIGLPREDREYQTGIVESFGPARRTVKFTHPFIGEPPKVVVWLTGVDLHSQLPKRVVVGAVNITRESFDMEINTWGNSLLIWASASWFAFSTSTGLAAGTIELKSIDGNKTKKGRTNYPTGKFGKQPRVFVALSGFEINVTAPLLPRRGYVTLRGEDKDGFDWEVGTWGDSEILQAAANWVALPSP